MIGSWRSVINLLPFETRLGSPDNQATEPILGGHDGNRSFGALIHRIQLVRPLEQAYERVGSPSWRGDHCNTTTEEKPILRHEYMVLPAVS